jgi:16S rRNA processing protein RimM
MPLDHFILGKLGAPRGLKGDLKLQSYSGEFAHILGQKTLELRGEGRSLVLKVLRSQENPDGATIAFEGYPTPEAARALTGLEIVAPRSGGAPLAENEWYAVDLAGLALYGPSGSESAGTELGKVLSVVEGCADPCLECLVAASGSRVLVPFRKEFVGKVDIEAGRLEILAPWILE